MAEIKGNKVFHRKKMVGKIVGYKYLTPRKEEHFYKKLGSFGIAKDIIELLQEREVLHIHFQYHTKEGRTTYGVNLDKFISEGQEIQEKGYERQVHLSVGKMYKSESNAVQQKITEVKFDTLKKEE